MRYITAIALLFILSTFYSCKTTEKRLYGTWHYVFDSIHLHKDKSFSFITRLADTSGLSQVNPNYKITPATYNGKWYVANNNLYLNFTDSALNNQLFGGCSYARVMKSIFFPIKLYRLPVCHSMYATKPVIYSKDKKAKII